MFSIEQNIMNTYVLNSDRKKGKHNIVLLKKQKKQDVRFGS